MAFCVGNNKQLMKENEAHNVAYFGNFKHLIFSLTVELIKGLLC